MANPQENLPEMRQLALTQAKQDLLAVYATKDHDLLTKAAKKLDNMGYLPDGAYGQLKEFQSGTELFLARNSRKVGLELTEAVGLAYIGTVSAFTVRGLATGGIWGGVFAFVATAYAAAIPAGFVAERTINTTKTLFMFLFQFKECVRSCTQLNVIKRHHVCTNEKTYQGRGISLFVSSLMPPGTVHQTSSDEITIQPCGQPLVRNDRGQTVGEKNRKGEVIKPHLAFRSPFELFFALADTLEWKPMSNQTFLDLLAEADLPFNHEMTKLFPKPKPFSKSFANTYPSTLTLASFEMVDNFQGGIYELNAYLYKQKKYFWRDHCCLFGKAGDEDYFQGSHGHGIIKYADLPEEAHHENLIRKATGELAIAVRNTSRVENAGDVVCAVGDDTLDEQEFGGPGTAAYLLGAAVGLACSPKFRQNLADTTSSAARYMPSHVQHFCGTFDSNSFLDYFEAGGRSGIAVSSRMLVKVGNRSIIFPDKSLPLTALNYLGSCDAGEVAALLARCARGHPKATCLVSVLATIEWKGKSTFQTIRSMYKARYHLNGFPDVKVELLTEEPDLPVVEDMEIIN